MAILIIGIPIYSLGIYLTNERYPHHGRIREVKVYDNAAQPEWVAQSCSPRMLRKTPNPQEPL